MRNKFNLKEFIFMNVGIILLSIGVYFFMIPDNLAAGGVTGLAMVINRYVPSLPIGLLMGIMNIILFILGFIFIGPKFGGKTIYASLAVSGMIFVLEKIYPMTKPITDDMFIQLIFGILISAVGMAIIFNQNASTGGTDIIAKILNRYFHIDIGKALLMVDFIVTILATMAFGPKKGMYALLGVIINGFTIDAVIEGLNIVKKVEIVSAKGGEIKSFIINNLERGATLYVAKGAYTHEEKEVITTVLGKKQFIRLKNHIKEVDPKAFIVTYNVHETLGEGFKDMSNEE